MSGAAKRSRLVSFEQPEDAVQQHPFARRRTERGRGEHAARFVRRGKTRTLDTPKGERNYARANGFSFDHCRGHARLNVGCTGPRRPWQSILVWVHPALLAGTVACAAHARCARGTGSGMAVGVQKTVAADGAPAAFNSSRRAPTASAVDPPRAEAYRRSRGSCRGCSRPRRPPSRRRACRRPVTTTGV